MALVAIPRRWAFRTQPLTSRTFPDHRCACHQALAASSYSSATTATTKASTVLVPASSGRIGKEVVARLAADSNFNVRAAVFTPEKAGYLKGLGADEIVRFDLQDDTTWDTAVNGVDCIYSASLDPLLEHHLQFSEYLGSLPRGQIKHVVRVSCMGADTNTASYDPELHISRAINAGDAPVPLMLQHYWWGEKALIDAGLPVTVLRCNFFMNHLLKTDVEQIDSEGWFSNPLGDTRCAKLQHLLLVLSPLADIYELFFLTGPAYCTHSLVTGWARTCYGA